MTSRHDPTCPDQVVDVEGGAGDVEHVVEVGRAAQIRRLFIQYHYGLPSGKPEGRVGMASREGTADAATHTASETGRKRTASQHVVPRWYYVSALAYHAGRHAKRRDEVLQAADRATHDDVPTKERGSLQRRHVFRDCHDTPPARPQRCAQQHDIVTPATHCEQARREASAG